MRDEHVRDGHIRDGHVKDAAQDVAGDVAKDSAEGVLCVVGSLLLEHTPSTPSTPKTKGKRLGQHACIGRPRTAWGRHACVGRV